MSVYACSDLHGNLELYNKVLSFLKPEDKLFFLGDACDRCDYGYEIMQDLFSRKNIVYIRGNHEQMFREACLEIRKNQTGLDYPETDAQTLCVYNGGRSTLRHWSNDDRPSNIVFNILKLPSFTLYTNKQNQTVVLTHSGSLTDELWDRDHFLKFEDIPKEQIYVHGHTPIQNLSKVVTTWDKTAHGGEENGEVTPLWYNNNQKVCIDCKTYITKQTLLLNLDTWEYHVIKIS